MNFEKNIYRSIEKASTETPITFIIAILLTLKENLNLDAISYLSYHQESDRLTLIHQIGFSFSDYESFDIPISTFEGKCAQKKMPIIDGEISSSPLFYDKGLLRHIPSDAIVVCPFFSPIPLEETRQVLGVLCCYPSDSSKCLEVRDFICEIEPLISKIYLSALDIQKMKTREQFVLKAGHSHELDGLLHRAAKLIRSQLSVASASIFLVDERNEMLRLRGATKRFESTKKEAIFFRPDSKDPTCAALENKICDIDIKSGENLTIRFWETDIATIANATVFPLIRVERKNITRIEVWEKGRSSRVFGVIRVINHKRDFATLSKPSHFSWEEEALLTFIGDLISQSVHFMKKGLNAEFDYIRRMHGAKNALQSAMMYLKIIRDHHFCPPPDAPYALSNAITYIDDVRAQIQRYEWREADELKIERVKLYSQVLAKLPPMIKEMGQSINLTNFQVNELSESGLPHLSTVRANRDALLSVFRNLVENAIKYSLNCDEQRIEITSIETEKEVEIHFRDWGMGVISNDAQLLFLEGFRGRQASDMHPSGTGFGLTDCKELLKMMGGSIRYQIVSVGSLFVVKLVKYDNSQYRKSEAPI